MQGRARSCHVGSSFLQLHVSGWRNWWCLGFAPRVRSHNTDFFLSITPAPHAPPLAWRKVKKVWIGHTLINLVEVRQEYCRAHHLSGNYRTASDTLIQVSTNRNASPWRHLHWRHDDRNMTSQWSARTFGGVTREVSSYIMMHMHGTVSESPGNFLISWFAVDPHRAKTGRFEKQSLWEGVPRQIYRWSAGLLISPSLPKPH